MLEDTEEPIKNGQSRETGNIGYTWRRKTKQKHNTICVGHHYTQNNTNNVHKRRLLLQTTGSIGEPNIVFILMDKNDGITTEIHNEFFTLSIQHTE